MDPIELGPIHLPFSSTSAKFYSTTYPHRNVHTPPWLPLPVARLEIRLSTKYNGTDHESLFRIGPKFFDVNTFLCPHSVAEVYQYLRLLPIDCLSSYMVATSLAAYAAVGALKTLAGGYAALAMLVQIDCTVTSPAVLEDDQLERAVRESEEMFEREGRPQTTPASAGMFESLEKFVWGAADDAKGGECCSICLEEFVPKACEVVLMPCDHVFHVDCMAKWLGVCNSCPLCRFQLPSSPAG